MSKAHAYLDAHMDTLILFKLIDSFYGLTLHSQIYCITHWIPAGQHVRAWKGWELMSLECSRNMYDFRETLCILGDSGYASDDDSSVGEADLRPFCLAVMPPPIKPVATPSLSKSGDVAGPSTSNQQVPKPKMICTPQAPKEPKLVKPVPAPRTNKVPPAKPAAPKRAVQTCAAANKKAPVSFKTKLAIKKPVVPDPSSNSEAKSEDEDKEDTMKEGIEEAPEEEEWLSDEIEAPPVKKPRLELAAGANPPPPHVYHPLTGMPLSGLLYVSFSAPTDPVPPLPPVESLSKVKDKEKAVALASPVSPSLRSCAAHNKRSPLCSSKDRCKTNKSPIASGSKVAAAATTTALLEADHVNNTIYMRAFHLQVDLQFHKPPSCQALEYMKLLMLPSAPDSLTNLPLNNLHDLGPPPRCIVVGSMCTGVIRTLIPISFVPCYLPHLATIVLCLGTLRSASSRATSVRRSAVDARLVTMVPALRAETPINFTVLPPFWTLSLLVVMELSAMASTMLSTSMPRLLYLVGRCTVCAKTMKRLSKIRQTQELNSGS
ncbi:hypothetical protein EDD85DRAFT_796134 [Armillaria nabsnona]|nr:hypothetical protein EDD85DRAFT_796134 [Armillaria nabsnona]